MTLRHVAVLGGEAHVIRGIAPCFRGEHARISQLGDEWILESSRFEQCSTPNEAFAAAEKLIAEMHQILALYLQLYMPLSATSILVYDDGTLVRRRLRASLEVSVYSADKTELSADLASASFGSAILARAATDPGVKAALELVSGQRFAWSRIYDIIEFLGDAEAIEKVGLASKNDVVRVRRTAAYHRHPGDPRPTMLPSNPPTFAEALAFANGLLKKWLRSRI